MSWVRALGREHQWRGAVFIPVLDRLREDGAEVFCAGWVGVEGGEVEGGGGVGV